MSGAGAGQNQWGGATASPTAQPVPVTPNSGFGLSPQQHPQASGATSPPVSPAGTGTASASQQQANQAASQPQPLPSALAPTAPAATDSANSANGVQANPQFQLNAPGGQPGSVPHPGANAPVLDWFSYYHANDVGGVDEGPLAGTQGQYTQKGFLQPQQAINTEFLNPAYLNVTNPHYNQYMGFNEAFGLPGTVSQFDQAFGLNGITPTQYGDLFNKLDPYNVNGTNTPVSFPGNPLMEAYTQEYGPDIAKSLTAEQAAEAKQLAAQGAYKTAEKQYQTQEQTYQQAVQQQAQAEANYQQQVAAYEAAQAAAQGGPLSPIGSNPNGGGGNYIVGGMNPVPYASNPTYYGGPTPASVQADQQAAAAAEQKALAAQFQAQQVAHGGVAGGAGVSIGSGGWGVSGLGGDAAGGQTPGPTTPGGEPSLAGQFHGGGGADSGAPGADSGANVDSGWGSAQTDNPANAYPSSGFDIGGLNPDFSGFSPQLTPQEGGSPSDYYGGSVPVQPADTSPGATFDPSAPFANPVDMTAPAPVSPPLSAPAYDPSAPFTNPVDMGAPPPPPTAAEPPITAPAQIPETPFLGMPAGDAFGGFGGGNTYSTAYNQATDLPMLGIGGLPASTGGNASGVFPDTTGLQPGQGTVGTPTTGALPFPDITGQAPAGALFPGGPPLPPTAPGQGQSEADKFVASLNGNFSMSNVLTAMGYDPTMAHLMYGINTNMTLDPTQDLASQLAAANMPMDQLNKALQDKWGINLQNIQQGYNPQPYGPSGTEAGYQSGTLDIGNQQYPDLSGLQSSPTLFGYPNNQPQPLSIQQLESGLQNGAFNMPSNFAPPSTPTPPANVPDATPAIDMGSKGVQDIVDQASSMSGIPNNIITDAGAYAANLIANSGGKADVTAAMQQYFAGEGYYPGEAFCGFFAGAFQSQLGQKSPSGYPTANAWNTWPAVNGLSGGADIPSVGDVLVKNTGQTSGQGGHVMSITQAGVDGPGTYLVTSANYDNFYVATTAELMSKNGFMGFTLRRNPSQTPPGGSVGPGSNALP